MNRSSSSWKSSLLCRWTDHTPDALSQGRVALRAAVRGYGLSEEAAADAVMAAAELMANAVEHGCGPYELHLRREENDLVCEVVDHDPRLPDVLVVFPKPTSPSPPGPVPGTMSPNAVSDHLDEGGRGLFIVNEVSRGAWGFRTTGQHKIVWCAIPLT